VTCVRPITLRVTTIVCRRLRSSLPSMDSPEPKIYPSCSSFSSLGSAFTMLNSHASFILVSWHSNNGSKRTAQPLKRLCHRWRPGQVRSVCDVIELVCVSLNISELFLLWKIYLIIPILQIDGNYFVRIAVAYETKVKRTISTYWLLIFRHFEVVIPIWARRSKIKDSITASTVSSFTDQWTLQYWQCAASTVNTTNNKILKYSYYYYCHYYHHHNHHKRQSIATNALVIIQICMVEHSKCRMS